MISELWLNLDGSGSGGGTTPPGAPVFHRGRNNAVGTFGGAYSPGDSAINLSAGHGPRFGVPTADEPVRVYAVPKSVQTAYGQIPGQLGSTVNSYTVTGRAGDRLTGVSHESGTDRPYGVNDVVWAGYGEETFEEIYSAILDLWNTVQAGGGGSGGTAAPVVNSLPAPTSSLRGTFVTLAAGGAPTNADRDTLWQCVQLQAGGYEWDQK